MATETKRISCVAGAYTALSAGKANVSFRLTTRGSGRMSISSTLPAAGTTDYTTVNSFWPVELGQLGETDNVYFMLDGSDAITVEVIRG